ncbi:putative homeobox transcription factor [Tieghemostelium lacteum]|uniref:Putative homeobox transcription factor n=1 Tax=Tieghemostelium lacteum TaxID=361077 RepID=A0A152A3E5_TIELA|nr:putative homeobox transcription factor [Tieghemostelium lacteum]|eukprot:KYR00724.1 putative homeobox transcription factor [Tieghemostelium lacteum]
MNLANFVIFPTDIAKPNKCNFNLKSYVDSILEIDKQSTSFQEFIHDNIEKYDKELKLLNENHIDHIKKYRDIKDSFSPKLENLESDFQEFIGEHVALSNNQYFWVKLTLRSIFCNKIYEEGVIQGSLREEKPYGNPILEKLYQSRNQKNVYLNSDEKLYMASICNTTVRKIDEWMGNKRNRVKKGSKPKRSIKKSKIAIKKESR